MEVLLGLSALHVMLEEALVGMYTLMCTKQWRPKSTNLVTPKKLQDVDQEPVLQIGSDRILLRYVYHKTFTVKFPDKCKWQNGFNPDNRVGLVWYTDGYKTNKGNGTWVYRYCWRGGTTSFLGSTPSNSRPKYALLRFV